MNKAGFTLSTTGAFRLNRTAPPRFDYLEKLRPKPSTQVPFDFCFALLFVFVFAPFFLLIALVTKLSSKGPVVYKQRRLGKDDRPFVLYKFRSMYVDAEKDGPALSRSNDPRITPWGRFMRRFKLDETPQFFNVLKGDMALVGPRPERAHFKSQWLRKNPRVRTLSAVKPGLTSLGQIKYGYASSLNQMNQRARYDLLYLKKRNFALDLEIIGSTAKHVILGKGSNYREQG